MLMRANSRAKDPSPMAVLKISSKNDLPKPEGVLSKPKISPEDDHPFNDQVEAFQRKAMTRKSQTS